MTIELSGTGDRAPLPRAKQARSRLRAVLAAGKKPRRPYRSAILPLMDASAPEWQATLDVVLALPEIGREGGLFRWRDRGRRAARGR